MAAFMDRLKSQLGYEPNEMLEPVAEPTLLQRIEDSSTLTTQQRLIGMGIAGLATCVCWSLVRARFSTSLYTKVYETKRRVSSQHVYVFAGLPVSACIQDVRLSQPCSVVSTTACHT